MQGKNVRWTPEQIARRKARNRKIILSFFLFLGVIVVLESPLTRVRTFVVSGNRTVPASKILGDTTLHVGMNLWQVSQEGTSEQIEKKEPIVQSVSVNTDMMRGIVSLEITEKHIVAIYEVGGKFYNLLNDGTAYQDIGVLGGLPFPVLTTEQGTPVKLGQIVNQDVGQVCRRLSLVDHQNLSSISEVHVDGHGVVLVYLDNGFVVTCTEAQLDAALPTAREAVQYFSSKGYQPGMIDLTGPPPYRYTPFSKVKANETVKKGG